MPPLNEYRKDTSKGQKWGNQCNRLKKKRKKKEKDIEIEASKQNREEEMHMKNLGVVELKNLLVGWREVG